MDELKDYMSQLGVKHAIRGDELHIYRPGDTNPERFKFKQHNYEGKDFFVVDDKVFQGETLLYKNAKSKFALGGEAPMAEKVTPAMQFARAVAVGLNSRNDFRSVLHTFAAPLQGMMGRDFDKLNDTEKSRVAGTTILMSQAERYQQMGMKANPGTALTKGLDSAFTVYAQYNNMGVNEETSKMQLGRVQHNIDQRGTKFRGEGQTLSSRVAYALDYITGKAGYAPGKDANHIGVYSDKTPGELFDDRIKQAKRVRSVREEYEIRSLNNKPTAGYSGGVMTMAAVDAPRVGAGKAVVSTSLYRNAYGMGQVRRQGIDIPGAADLTQFNRTFDANAADDTQNEIAFWGNQSIELGSFGKERIALDKTGFQGKMIKRDSLQLSLGYDSATREMLSRALPGMKGLIDQTFSSYDIDPIGANLRQTVMDEVGRMTGLNVTFGGSTNESTQLQFEGADLIRMRATKETGGFKVADTYNHLLSNALERDNVARAVGLDDVKTRDRKSLMGGIMNSPDPRFLSARKAFEANLGKTFDHEQALDAALQHMEGEDFRKQFVNGDLTAYGGKLPYFFPMSNMGMTVEYGSKRQMMMSADHLSEMAKTAPELADAIVSRQVAKGQPYMELYGAMSGMSAPELKAPEGGIQTDWTPSMGSGQTIERLQEIGKSIGTGAFSMDGVSLPGVKAMEQFAASPKLIGPYMNALMGKGKAEDFINVARDEFQNSVEFRKQFAASDAVPGIFGRYTSTERTDENVYVGPDELKELASQMKTSPGKLLEAMKSEEGVYAEYGRYPNLSGKNMRGRLMFGEDVRGITVNKQFNVSEQGDEDQDPAGLHVMAETDADGNVVNLPGAKKAYEQFVSAGGSAGRAVQRLAAIGGEEDFSRHLNELRIAYPELSGAALDKAILFGHGDKKAYAPTIPGTKNSANPYADAAQSRSEKFAKGLTGIFGVPLQQLNKSVMALGIGQFAEKKKAMGIYNMLRAMNGNMDIDEKAYSSAFPNRGAALRSLYGDNAPSALSQDKEHAAMVYQIALDMGKISPKLMEAYGRFNFENNPNATGSLAYSLAKGMQDTAQFTPEYIAGATVAPGENYEARLATRADEINNGSGYTVDPGSPLFQTSAASIYHNMVRSGSGTDEERLALIDQAGSRALNIDAVTKRKNVPLGEFAQASTSNGPLGRIWEGLKDKLGFSGGNPSQAFPEKSRGGETPRPQPKKEAAPSAAAAAPQSNVTTEYSDADMPDGGVSDFEAPPVEAQDPTGAHPLMREEAAKAKARNSGGQGGGGGGGNTATAAPMMDDDDEDGPNGWKGFVSSLQEAMSGGGGGYGKTNAAKVQGIQFQPGAAALSGFLGKMKSTGKSASFLVQNDPEAAQFYREMGRYERGFVDKYNQFATGNMASPAARQDLEQRARMHAFGRQDEIADSDRNVLQGVFGDIAAANAPSGGLRQTSSAISKDLTALSSSLSGNNSTSKIGDVIKAVSGSMERLVKATDAFTDDMEKALPTVGAATEAFDEVQSATKSYSKNLGALRKQLPGMTGPDAELAKSVLSQSHQLIGSTESMMSAEGQFGQYVQKQFGGMEAYDQVSGNGRGMGRSLLNGFLAFQVARAARYTLSPLEQNAREYEGINMAGNETMAQAGMGVNYNAMPYGQARQLASNFRYNFGRQSAYVGGGLGILGNTGVGQLGLGLAEAAGTVALPGAGTMMVAASFGQTLNSPGLIRAAPALGLAAAATVGGLSALGAANDPQSQGRLNAFIGNTPQGLGRLSALGKDFWGVIGNAANTVFGESDDVKRSSEMYQSVYKDAMRGGYFDTKNLSPGQASALVDYATWDDNSAFSQIAKFYNVNKEQQRSLSSTVMMRSQGGEYNMHLYERLVRGTATGESSEALLSAGDELSSQLGDPNVLGGDRFILNNSLVGLKQMGRTVSNLGGVQTAIESAMAGGDGYAYTKQEMEDIATSGQMVDPIQGQMYRQQRVTLPRMGTYAQSVGFSGSQEDGIDYMGRLMGAAEEGVYSDAQQSAAQEAAGRYYGMGAQLARNGLFRGNVDDAASEMERMYEMRKDEKGRAVGLTSSQQLAMSESERALPMLLRQKKLGMITEGDITSKLEDLSYSNDLYTDMNRISNETEAGDILASSGISTGVNLTAPAMAAQMSKWNISGSQYSSILQQAAQRKGDFSMAGWQNLISDSVNPFMEAQANQNFQTLGGYQSAAAAAQAGGMSYGGALSQLRSMSNFGVMTPKDALLFQQNRVTLPGIAGQVVSSGLFNDTGKAEAAFAGVMGTAKDGIYTNQQIQGLQEYMGTAAQMSAGWQLMGGITDPEEANKQGLAYAPKNYDQEGRLTGMTDLQKSRASMASSLAPTISRLKRLGSINAAEASGMDVWFRQSGTYDAMEDAQARLEAADLLKSEGVQDIKGLDTKLRDTAKAGGISVGQARSLLRGWANIHGDYSLNAGLSLAGQTNVDFGKVQMAMANFSQMGGQGGQQTAYAMGMSSQGWNSMVMGPQLSPLQAEGFQSLMGGDSFMMAKMGQASFAFGSSAAGSLGPGVNPNTGFGRYQRDMYGLNNQFRNPTRAEIGGWMTQTWNRNSAGSAMSGRWGTGGAGAERIISALDGTTFGVGGMAGAGLLMNQYQYEGAAAAAGAQIAQLTANHNYAKNVEQPYKLTQLQMGYASDFGGTVQSDFMKSHNIGPVNFGRGRFAREWASMALQEQDMAAQMDQTRTRAAWNMEDISRAAGQSRTRFQWQREDLSLGREKQLLNRGMQEYQFQFQQREMGFQRQELNINRQAYREDYQFNRQVNQLQFGWQMEDYDTNIRRATGFQRRQLIKERDRATQMQNLERGHSEKVNDRQEDAFKRQEESMKRQEEYFKKQVDHFKQTNKLEDEEYRRNKNRLEEQSKWSEQDFNIKLGRAAQELAWAEEAAKRQQAQMDLKKEALTVEEDAAKANHELEMARFEEEKKHEEEMYHLAVAAAGAGLAAMKKQMELNELIGKMQEEVETHQVGVYTLMKNIRWEAMRDAFLAAWKLANEGGGAGDGGGGPPGKTAAGGGDVKAGETYLVGENGPELFNPKHNGKIVPLPDFAVAKEQPSKQAPAGDTRPINFVFQIDSGVLVKKMIEHGGRDIYLAESRSW